MLSRLYKYFLIIFDTMILNDSYIKIRRKRITNKHQTFVMSLSLHDDNIIRVYGSSIVR